MNDERPRFTTMVTLTVEVNHWGTVSPQNAVDLIRMNLQFPAIKSIEINDVKSNHTNHDGPLPCLHYVNNYK